MMCVNELTLTEYICAIGDIVEPKNIIASLTISNNRICIYLATKELVNQVTNKHDFLEIKGQKVYIRPLIGKYKRVIFSNVAANVPNYVFEDILDQLKVNRNSSISILKASIGKNGYDHVISSRRQRFVKIEDTHKIPEIFRLN